MALTLPYTAEIHAGTSSAVVFGPMDREGGMQGFGNPEIRDSDQARGSRDGDAGGLDRHTARILRFALELDEDDGPLKSQLRPLKAAWRASAGDTTLDVLDPLFDTSDNILRWYGRPRMLEADTNVSDFGLIPVVFSFKCLDPFGYGAPETVTDSSSPASVTNSGDVASDRFTIAITGNGGTPVVTNTTDEAAAVAFNTTLAGGAVAVLNFRTHTMTVGGTATYLLAPGSTWFRLLAGANTLTFSGCASIEVVHRPAFL